MEDEGGGDPPFLLGRLFSWGQEINTHYEGALRGEHPGEWARGAASRDG